MSPTVRAFYGALIGALVVLLAHPYSRPYVTQGLWFVGDSDFLLRTAMLPENLDTLPEPNTLDVAGLWAVTACERNMTAKPLSSRETLLVIEVVQAAAEADPDNGFWRQTEAALLHRSGNEEAARRAWSTAAFASRWDDYQYRRLTNILNGLASNSGENLGWHYAFVDSRKSTFVNQAIMKYARSTLRGERAQDLEARVETLRNGRLLRDGCRTIEGTETGAGIIELAAYCALEKQRGASLGGSTLSPRQIVVARNDLIVAVRNEMPNVENEVKEAFLENDARLAFLGDETTAPHHVRLVVVAFLAAVLPGVFFSIGMVGAGIYLIGLIFSRSKALQLALTPPWALVVGAFAGIAVFALSGLFFPSLWASVSLGSFVVRRDSERLAVPGGLGGAYGLTHVVLAVGLSLILGMYFSLISLPGRHLLDEAGLSTAPIVSEAALVSLAGVVASLALVTASVWGFLSRIPPERLAGPSLVKFGRIVGIGCFALGVAITPIAIAADRSVGDSLSKIVQNEPTYYLTR